MPKKTKTKYSLATPCVYAYGFVNYDDKTVDNIDELMSHIELFCNEYSRIEKYYLIAHTETNVLHIHFVLAMRGQTRLITLFNKLSTSIKHDIRDVNAITIDKADDFNFQVKYILHKDTTSVRLNKKMYEIEDIYSNDSYENIEGIIRSKKGVCDAYYLRDAVLDCDDDFQLMVKLGLSTYHRFSREIQAIKEMRPRLLIQREEERKEEIDAIKLIALDNGEDLPF